MSQPLQSKLQLLGVLAVAFVLLSVPLFYQVRADAADGRAEARNTFLSKMFRDVAKDIAKKPPEDLQVEDAWQQWQEQNPNCGSECDPDADADGDGMSNKDEIANKRNPACNEEKEGKEYCAGQPTVPPVVQNQTKALDDTLFEKTNVNAGFTEDFSVAAVAPEYDRWIVAYGVTGYQGVNGYTVRLEDEAGESFCCDARNPEFLQDADSAESTLQGTSLPPSGATYTIRLDSQALQGQWYILVRGIRDAR